jgi:hypothetical protein
VNRDYSAIGIANLARELNGSSPVFLVQSKHDILDHEMSSCDEEEKIIGDSLRLSESFRKSIQSIHSSCTAKGTHLTFRISSSTSLKNIFV